MQINVQFDMRGLVSWEKNGNASVFRAMQAAGTSALRAMRAEGSRRIRETKGIQVGYIDTALTMVYPTTKPVWTLVAKHKSLPLVAFGARQTKTGVSVEVTKGKRAIVKHAFLATMQSGHKGVFMRRGPKRMAGKGKYAGKMRQPIYETYTASVASTLGKVGDQVLKRGESVFRDTFNRLTGAR
jgi:hypothetical protein